MKKIKWFTGKRKWLTVFSVTFCKETISRVQKTWRLCIFLVSCARDEIPSSDLESCLELSFSFPNVKWLLFFFEYEPFPSLYLASYSGHFWNIQLHFICSFSSKKIHPHLSPAPWHIPRRLSTSLRTRANSPLRLLNKDKFVKPEMSYIAKWFKIFWQYNLPSTSIIMFCGLILW